MTTIFQCDANFQQSPERWESWESNAATAQSCALRAQKNAAGGRRGHAPTPTVAAAGFDNGATLACRRPATHHRPQ
jgi:hypothetical protein